MSSLAELKAERDRRANGSSLNHLLAEKKKRSEAKLAQQAPQQAAPQDDGLVGPMEGFKGFLETGAAVASGAMAEPIAGLVGLGAAVNPLLEPGAGGRAVEATREALTYQPRSKAVQQNFQDVGESMAPVTEAIEGVEDAFGDVGYAIGGPTGGAIGKAIPTAIGSAIPGSTVGKGMFKFGSPTKMKIAEMIQKGSTDSELAKFDLIPTPLKDAGLVKSKEAVKAIDQGFDEGVIQPMKLASEPTKKKMLRMVDIMEKGKKNHLYAAENRPGQVAGETLVERFNTVRDVNRRAGKDLDVIAKGLKGQEVDPAPAFDQFMTDIDDMGINLQNKLDSEGNPIEGTIEPNFRNSDIEDVGPAETIINNIVKRLGRLDNPDAFDLHRLKRFLSESISGKKMEGLTGQTTVILEKLRKNVDKILDDKFPEYDKVNTAYADTIGAMDSLQTIAGKKMKMYGPNADKDIGQLLRRTLSNARSRVPLMDSIANIDSVANKYANYTGTGPLRIGNKAKGIEDDLMMQIVFADELDAVFDGSPRTSFKGQIDQSLATAAKQGAKAGAREMAADMAIGVGRRIKGVNEENAFKTIRELLKAKN